MVNVIKEILVDEKSGKYSQGRVYLLLSILAYYGCLGTLMAYGLRKETQVDLTSFEIIIESLKYAMALFGGYVFGGKFLNVITSLGSLKFGPTNNEKPAKGSKKEILND